MAAHTLYSEFVSFEEPAIANVLFGVHNVHLQLLQQASGAELSNRGASLTIKAESPQVCQRLCNLFVQLYTLLKQGAALSQQDMVRAYRMLEADPGLKIAQVYRDAVFVTTPNKTVTARNLAQKSYLEMLQKHEMVFAVGPAGTGKTYLAVAMALSLLQQHRVKRIILTRPAVEAGERLGFLPGDLAEKVNPYLRPLYDALYDMMPQVKVAGMMETGIIEIAPLAFMRGRTLNDAFIILDEAQNTTHEQMKMFLTRMGFGSRVVITGDISQIDLPVQGNADPRSRSGLVHALQLLRTVPAIGFNLFSKEDVVRHPLVGAIVSAYDRTEK